MYVVQLARRRLSEVGGAFGIDDEASEADQTGETQRTNYTHETSERQNERT